MTLNVAFYSPGWPAETAQNGIVTYVESLVPAMDARGARGFVIAPAGVALPDGDSFINLAPDESGLFGKAWTRAQWKLGRGEQALHAGRARAIAGAVLRLSEKTPIHILEMEESFGWARTIQKMLNIPVVVRIHGPHFIAEQNQSARGRQHQRARRIANEGAAILNAQGLTCPSKGLLASVRNFYGGAGKISRVIPNPIESEPDSQRWRLEDCDRNMLLFIGRFDDCKGADIAIRAFSKAARKLPDLRLVMAGSDHGVRIDSGEILRFQEYADRFIPADMRTRIDFLDRTPREQLKALRKKALAHLSTSRHECFAYAVSESLAAGLPVIASNTFGPPELLERDRDFLCAEIGDVDALADHIDRLAADPGKAAAIAENGWRACRELLSPQRIANETLVFYESVRDASTTDRRDAEKLRGAQ